MSTGTIHFVRSISTSCINYGKRNFRVIQLYNKRGQRDFKEQKAAKKHDGFLVVNKRGLKSTGYDDKWGNFHEIPERIPQLVVPDLDKFHLKPYVSYRGDDVKTSEFTAESLFNAVYANKIIDDFDKKKLNADGTPMEPSELENLTPKQAKDNASKTGTDLFTHDDKRKLWE